jgi:hypothetical protein
MTGAEVRIVFENWQQMATEAGEARDQSGANQLWKPKVAG